MFYLNKNNGFTLIEILIALSLVAIGLISALRASSTLTQQQSDLSLRLRAQWAANYHIAKHRLEQDWPELGERIRDCDQGGLEMFCKEKVSASINPAFRILEISVYNNAQLETRLAQLTTLISDGRRNLF